MSSKFEHRIICNFQLKRSETTISDQKEKLILLVASLIIVNGLINILHPQINVRDKVSGMLERQVRVISVMGESLINRGLMKTIAYGFSSLNDNVDIDNSYVSAMIHDD